MGVWQRFLLPLLKSKPTADEAISGSSRPDLDPMERGPNGELLPFGERWKRLRDGSSVDQVLEVLGPPIETKTMSQSLAGSRGLVVLSRESLRAVEEQVMFVYPDPGDGIEYLVFVKHGVLIDRRGMVKTNQTDSTDAAGS